MTTEEVRTIVDLLKEATKNYIPSTKQNNRDGGFGNTLEDLFGVQENNLQQADWNGIELKSHRVNTNGGGSGGSGRSSSSVGSLRSSGSAKTGDATPIAAVGATMMLALAGLVVLRKKGK